MENNVDDLQSKGEFCTHFNKFKVYPSDVLKHNTQENKIYFQIIILTFCLRITTQLK